MNELLQKLTSWTQSPRMVIGIMTGTSLDGIDCALCRLETINNTVTINLVHYICENYPKNIKELIQKVLIQDCPISDYGYLHFELGRVYAETVKNLCKKSGVVQTDIDLVCIHGQTLWHEPNERKFTLQAGNGEVLAKILGIPVISDFRSGDIALGGQGAPLVPIFDKYFFGDKEKKNVLVNIGGMANITVLPPTGSDEKIIAFDTGPGNVLIDSLMKYYFDKQYDENGLTAQQGICNQKLFDDISSIPFFYESPPKSTGRELFGEELIETIIKQYEYISSYDIIRTVTDITAWSIADHIKRYAHDTEKVICSGGGIYNKILMQLLHQYLPDKTIISTEEYGINSDAKEAMCFAFMGYRTLAGLPSNVPTVTGSAYESILGSLSFP